MIAVVIDRRDGTQGTEVYLFKNDEKAIEWISQEAVDRADIDQSEKKDYGNSDDLNDDEYVQYVLLENDSFAGKTYIYTIADANNMSSWKGVGLSKQAMKKVVDFKVTYDK